MCDPMVGIALSIASAGMSAMQQSQAQSMQEQANNEWVAYQTQKSREEWQRQEELRQQAETARSESVTELAAPAAKDAQQTEQTRLMNDVAPEQTPQQQAALVGDRLLSGQAGSSVLAPTFASQINDASKNARARIQALATMASYTGSQFGLQNRAKQILNTSGNAIGLIGNERSGSLGAYQAEKAVPVAHVSSSPSAFGGIANSLAGIAGKGLGQSFAGAPPAV